MRSEKDKMLGGELYDPLDPQLSAERRQARLLFKALNDTRDDEVDERARLIRALIPTAGRDLWIEPPFYCDYGSNITLGDKVFFNSATRMRAMIRVDTIEGPPSKQHRLPYRRSPTSRLVRGTLALWLCGELARSAAREDAAAAACGSTPVTPTPGLWRIHGDHARDVAAFSKDVLVDHSMT
jgi:hypothetical protein